MKRHVVIHLVIVVAMLFALLPVAAAAQAGVDARYVIALKSREFIPQPGIEPALAQEQAAAGAGRRHILLQFDDVPSDAQRAALENAGVRLLAYLPNHAWFASLPGGLSLQHPGLATVRWMGAIQAADRTAPILRQPGARQALLDGQGQLGLDVRFFSDVEPGQAVTLLRAHDATIEEKAADFNRYAVRIDPEVLDLLAKEDDVQWIAPAPPPKATDNDGTRAQTSVDIVHASPYSLSGSGVDLGIWDGGRVDGHIDFSGRLTVVEAGAPLGDHATHVAGTMAGDGSNSANQGGTAYQWKGMAPGADILSYYWDNATTDHNGAINTYGIELSQNSWGYTVDEAAFGNCYLYGDYDYDAPDYDEIITGLYGKRISVVFSGGNERNDGDCGMSSTPPYINYANVGPPGTAKNVIAVGATNSNDDSMTTFSSWGPLDDGRIKPDIVAPGCESTGEGYIHSTLPGDVYGDPGWCGTSMAAPAVSGISGLLIQQYRSTFGPDPLPSTVKALLIQRAVDMNDGTSYYNPGPDYASGYGRVDAQAAVDVVISGDLREDQVSNSQADVFTFDVAAGTPSLKVTLVWDDEAGAVNANPALVNNLDLILVEPDGTTTHLPWVLNPASPSSNATTGTDSINNVEQVVVSSPVAGTWEVHVVGTSVPVGPQLYSLAGGAFGGSGPGDVGPVVYDGHVIDDDNNGNSIGNDDGIVNPGETIELYVALHNDGTDEATGVSATISTSDPYVTFTFNTSSDYDNIPGGGTATNLNDFDFEVSPGAPNGHVIHFDLDIVASNGGPWTDGFDISVTGQGPGGSLALISDQTELQAITPILDSMGLTYDVLNNNWDGAQGIYTSNYGFLGDYAVVVWYASGYTYGRLITQQEHDALEQYLQAGGRLLVTGYDTLGSPTDSLLADLVRSSSSGDGPFTYDYTITDGDHPITNGPFGTFAAGTALRTAYTDHDQAEADTGRGATTVAELAGGRDKILAAELASGGIVVYWNGNRIVSDWTGVLSTLKEQEGERDRKRTADGQPLGTLTLKDLQDRAQRIEPGDIPAESNYGGSEPVWVVPRETLSDALADLSPQGSQSVAFPATSDTISVESNPYWWHAGDYAEGTRSLSMSSVNRLDYDWSTTYNSLNGTGHVDLVLSINGTVVGSFTVNPGEYAKLVSFTFAPISGPSYTIRLEETNTVDSGMGSIYIPLDMSTMTFFGPSTTEQVNTCPSPTRPSIRRGT
ncbi:MAG: S8 family serine peptidase [Anaerolineae bacterium]